MKITVINGTEKKGVTYRLKEIFLEQFRSSAEITEFYLPRDLPGFCIGCTQCFRDNAGACKDAEYVKRIETALLEADLLVTSAVGNSSMVQAAGQENDGEYDFEEYPESGVEWFE